jgi:hypothetical protein
MTPCAPAGGMLHRAPLSSWPRAIPPNFPPIPSSCARRCCPASVTEPCEAEFQPVDADLSNGRRRAFELPSAVVDAFAIREAKDDRAPRAIAYVIGASRERPEFLQRGRVETMRRLFKAGIPSGPVGADPSCEADASLVSQLNRARVARDYVAPSQQGVAILVQRNAAFMCRAASPLHAHAHEAAPPQFGELTSFPESLIP